MWLLILRNWKLIGVVAGVAAVLSAVAILSIKVANLRAENAEWGVRDVSDLNGLARSAGLTDAEISPMPANNLVLAFTRALGQN